MEKKQDCFFRDMINITVIIPTYHRPKDLKRCLEALKKQICPANEVLVVVRDRDRETWEFFETFNFSSLPLEILKVTVPGVVAAMNLGLEASQGDIIAFTDDDAAPHPDWLESIKSNFMANDLLGGLGGRDRVYFGTQMINGEKEIVGRLQWFGRVIGNHHLGIGEPREVDVLKGVNMSFRRTAIASMTFDRRMRGTGAQVDFELAFCLKLKRAGWKLIYDPKIIVDHYPAKRFDEDQRRQFNSIALTNAVHNETLALLEFFPSLQQAIFLIWSILVGTRKRLGLVQLLRFLPSEGPLAFRKWLAAMHGRWQGWLTFQQSYKT